MIAIWLLISFLIASILARTMSVNNHKFYKLYKPNDEGGKMKSVEEKVKEMISKQFDVSKEDITIETSLVNDLEADSFDIVEMVTILEGDFGIVISDEDIEAISTVGDLVKYIDRAIGTHLS